MSMGVPVPAKPRRQAFHGKAKTLALGALAVCAFIAVVWECLVEPIDLVPFEQRRTNLKATTNGRIAPSFASKMYNIPESVDISISAFVEGSIPAASKDRIRSASGNVSSTVYNPLNGCSVTSQVQIHAPSASSESSSQKWTLQAVNQFGRKKTVGGDEFYITYHSPSDWNGNGTSKVPIGRTPPTAVALIADNKDGTYELTFVAPPQMTPNEGAMMHPTSAARRTQDGDRHGVLTVYFLYSCGIGNSYKPLKDHWRFGGNTNIHHSIEVQRPPIRPFTPPTSAVDLGQFRTIVFHGDSLMRQFSVYFKEYGNTKRLSHGFSYQGNTNMFLARSTFAAWIQSLEDWHGDMLRGNNVALITGSSTWDITKGEDIQGPYFNDHLATVRGLVREVRTRYPKVHMFWKLPSALHLQMADSTTCWNVTKNPKCVQRLAYMSESRVKFVREQQKAIMDELNVTVLDVYQGSYLSAHQHQPGDSVHYESVFSRHMLNWFFQQKRNFTDGL